MRSESTSSLKQNGGGNMGICDYANANGLITPAAKGVDSAGEAVDIAVEDDTLTDRESGDLTAIFYEAGEAHAPVCMPNSTVGVEITPPTPLDPQDRSAVPVEYTVSHYTTGSPSFTARFAVIFNYSGGGFVDTKLLEMPAGESVTRTVELDLSSIQPGEERELCARILGSFE